MITKEDYEKAKDIVKKFEKNLNISDVIDAKRKVCSKCGSTMLAEMDEGWWCQSCGYVG